MKISPIFNFHLNFCIFRGGIDITLDKERKLVIKL